MHEEAVGPGLTGRGGVPLIADRKLRGQLAEDRHLLRSVEMHHGAWIVGPGRCAIRGLSGIAFDESAHRGRSVLRRRGGLEDLGVDVGEELPWVRRWNCHAARILARSIPDA